MPEGLLVKYNKARKVSKALNEYHRTGKTKEERQPIEDDRNGTLDLYTVTDIIDDVTTYSPQLPLSGYARPEIGKSKSKILHKLMFKSPTKLFYLDESVGKLIYGDAFGVEMIKNQLDSLGVSATDIEYVISCTSGDRLPAYFNQPMLTDRKSVV